MIDRLTKTSDLEPWRVQASTETHKDKEQESESEQQQEESSKDAFALLSEQSDWSALLDKNKLWKKNTQIGQNEVEAVIFRKINLRTDPSLICVDVRLKNGDKISPAFISIARAFALKLKTLVSGQEIPDEFIFQDQVLRLTIPVEAPKDHKQTKAPQIPQTPVEQDPEEEPTLIGKKNKTKTSILKIKDPVTHNVHLEGLLFYGVVIWIVLIVIGGLILLV